MHSSNMLKINLRVDGIDFEEAGSYIFLEQEVNMRHNPQAKIVCRRSAEWRKFLHSIINVLKESDPGDCVGNKMAD